MLGCCVKYFVNCEELCVSEDPEVGGMVFGFEELVDD